MRETLIEKAAKGHYPNSVDPHPFRSAGGAGADAELCWYCSHAESYSLHAEPQASDFSRQVEAARQAQG
jgi:hypothetical protein